MNQYGAVDKHVVRANVYFVSLDESYDVSTYFQFSVNFPVASRRTHW